MKAIHSRSANRRHWQNPALLAFASAHNSDDPLAVALEKTRRTIAMLGLGDLPIPLRPIIKVSGIKARMAAMSLAGVLVPLKDGRFDVVINRSHPLARQRFTLAHEIGHTYFYQYRISGDTPASRPPSLCSWNMSNEEEQLCDRIAAEILMPHGVFESEVRRLGISARSLLTLANLFCVSVTALAIRLVESDDWNCVVIGWRKLTRPGSTPKLRVAWSASPNRIRCYVPKWKPAAEASSVAEVFRTRRDCGGFEDLDLGSLRGTYWIESACFGDEVISIVKLDEDLPISQFMDIARGVEQVQLTKDRQHVA